VSARALTHPLARRALFALLYFSEGAPIGYVWWAMPTRLRQAGMPVEEVAALTAMLTLPWAFKFLWAPFVDRLRGPRWGYRAWITVAQVAMGLSLLPLGFLDAQSLATYATIFLLAHSISAATQDVAIDAMAIATIPHEERARTTGWMQAGMLVGRAAFGGLALAAEAWIGAENVVFILVGCVWTTLAILWIAPALPIVSERAQETERGSLLGLIARALRRRSTWIGLGVALTAGAGFEATGGLIGPMLTDRGAAQESIGWFFALPVVTLMIVGGLLGGFVADRAGHRRMVIASILAIAACVGSIALVDALTIDAWLAIMVVASPLYLFIGSLTASSYALFMDLTDPAIGGTQFSAFMGATNLCEVWAIALGGALAGSIGYGAGLLAPVAVSLLAIGLVLALRNGAEDKAARI
jgi:MFS family permease